MAALIGEAVARGVPERFHTITPQLAVADADAAITFYRQVFGARELVRNHHDSGRVMHAELVIGDSLLLVHDDFSDLGGPAAAAPGTSPSQSTSTCQTQTQPSSTRSVQAPAPCCPWPAAHGATATGSSKSRSGTDGQSAPEAHPRNNTRGSATLYQQAPSPTWNTALRRPMKGVAAL